MIVIIGVSGAIVLIESDWNLKNIATRPSWNFVKVLIESDWNLKERVWMFNRFSSFCINRIRLEFKGNCSTTGADAGHMY